MKIGRGKRESFGGSSFLFPYFKSHKHRKDSPIALFLFQENALKCSYNYRSAFIDIALRKQHSPNTNVEMAQKA